MESKPVEEVKASKKYSTNKRVKFIKMKAIDSLKKDNLTKDVLNLVEEESKVITDKSNSYNNLQKYYEHKASVVPKKKINEFLPWIHKAISIAKRLFLDAHHRIDDDFLQSYLNEFCVKFNALTNKAKELTQAF